VVPKACFLIDWCFVHVGGSPALLGLPAV